MKEKRRSQSGGIQIFLKLEFLAGLALSCFLKGI